MRLFLSRPFPIFPAQATGRELVWVMRGCILAAAIVSTLIAIFSTTVLGLFILCSDMMYVVLFPQLTSVLWLPWSNAYGCVAGFFLSFLMRMLCGETLIGLPAAIHFPLYDEVTKTQNFCYRTLSMLVGGLTLSLVSLLTNYIFMNGLIPERYDILKCRLKRSVHMRITPKRFEENGDKCDNQQTIELISDPKT